jgi:hypothetical protein
MSGKKRDNAGHFRPGHDPRRHTLTDEEASRGGRTTWLKLMEKRPEWLG